MDVYHKILARIYKDSDGQESVRVDFGEILKQEGFFPSIEQIASHMIKEGWITDSDRKHHVQITHWGIAEAKKAAKGVPDSSKAIEKDCNALVSRAKEITVMSEEFAGAPSKKKLNEIEKSLTEITKVIERLSDNVS